jgi:hypothetical protein
LVPRRRRSHPLCADNRLLRRSLDIADGPAMCEGQAVSVWFLGLRSARGRPLGVLGCGKGWLGAFARQRPPERRRCGRIELCHR